MTLSGEFEFFEPFGIDDGELDGLNPQQCFVLGYELATITSAADHSGDGFERRVHAANRVRLADALERRNRRFSLTFLHDDVSEAWMQLRVEPA